MPTIGQLVNLAGTVADVAGQTAMHYFRQGVAIDDKADESPVTIADRETEAAMREIIGAAFPDHGIFGEEHGQSGLDADYVWVLDPIDGTKSFVTGKPLFGNLIAVLKDGKPVVGIINMPAIGERWVGAEGVPTTFNGQTARTRACARLSDAWLYATSPYMFEGENAEAFERVRASVKHDVYGGDCYAYGLLANGSVDVVVEADLQPYDYCALVPVVNGAGGLFTDWQGGALDLKSEGKVAVAGDPALHATLLQRLNGRS